MTTWKKMRKIELLSIDLSNYCSKECPFCYNHSHRAGNIMWTPDEVISFATDCIDNGIKAVSLGGGEPFEYDGIFRVIDALQPLAYLSVTTNGLPLLEPQTWVALLHHRPDKVHITIHNPDDNVEVNRVLRQLSLLSDTEITPGVNLLVDSTKLDFCRIAYRKLREVLEPRQIILVPMRFGNTPTPKELALVTDGENFQAPSCIIKCRRPENFCSVSWDKKVNSCSYAGGKQPLASLTYQGLMDSLAKIDFTSCQSSSII